jgi:hypothetical protein
MTRAGTTRPALRAALAAALLLTGSNATKPLVIDDAVWSHS